MKIVGITSCPSGVAHTYMAAEALESTGKKRGHEVHVETQGSIGIENKLTQEQIDQADVVILTKDMAIIEEDRFEGKKIVRVAISDLVAKTELILEKIEQAIAASK